MVDSDQGCMYRDFIVPDGALHMIGNTITRASKAASHATIVASLVELLTPRLGAERAALIGSHCARHVLLSRPRQPSPQAKQRGSSYAPLTSIQSSSMHSIAMDLELAQPLKEQALPDTFPVEEGDEFLFGEEYVEKVLARRPLTFEAGLSASPMQQAAKKQHEVYNLADGPLATAHLLLFGQQAIELDMQQQLQQPEHLHEQQQQQQMQPEELLFGEEYLEYEAQQRQQQQQQRSNIEPTPDQDERDGIDENDDDFAGVDEQEAAKKQPMVA